MVRAWLAVVAVLVGVSLSFAAAGDSALRGNQQWEQARKDLAQGKAAEAKTEFERLLADYPNEPDLHLFLGMALLRLRDPHGAEVAARKAIALNPQHVDARTFLAWIELEVRGDVNAAINEYQKIIELHPELPDAYSNLAVAQKRKGDLDGAVLSLNRALERKPDFASALTTRGGILAEQNKWPEARRDFDAALKLDPRDDGALYGVAQALRESRDYAGAQQAMSRLIARSPNFVYWLEWGRIGLIRYWWVLLAAAIAFAVKGWFKKARMEANG
jgi:tetratricopeptide (TPR) repeat protein